MKKFLSIVMVSSILLGVSSCGVGSQNTGNNVATANPSSISTASSSSTINEVTLKMSFNGDFTKMADAVIGATDSLNKKYAAEGKNIKVKIDTDYQTIDNSQYHNNMIFAHKNGDAPDIFSCDSNVAGYVNAKSVLDITDVITDKMVPNVTKPSTINGKVYAMPFDLPLRVVYYNKNDLKKIGWTDEQINALPVDIKSGKVSLEDFMNICSEVVKKGGATYGLVHRPSSGDDFYDLLNAVGGQYYNEKGQLVFDESGINRMFQLLYNNAQVSKITPSNLNQMGWDSINKMVGNGDAFAYFGPMYSATYVAKAAGVDIDNFAKQEAFVLFPKSKDSSAAFCTAAPQFMAISSDTKYPEICKDIFKELQGDSANLLADHSASTFSFSSVKAANKMDEITKSPILGPVTYMVDYAQSIPAIDKASSLRDLIFKEIVSLELGQTTPEKATADLKEQAKLNIDGIIMK